MSLNKNALNYGLILGAVLIVLSLIIYIFDLYENNFVSSFLSDVIIIIVIILGTKSYRDKQLNGFITYGKSFTSGLLIGFFASIVLAIFTFLFYKYFAPDVINHLSDIAQQKLIDKMPEITDEQLDQAMAIKQKFMNPGWMSFMTIVGTTLWALVFSLIISAFLKKEDKSLQANL